MADEILQLANISKSFSGVQALQNVSLTIQRGEVYCLVGENGSGKSTLIKVIAGVVQPDAGEIFINGKKFDTVSPIAAIREGIQVIYQDFSLFPNLTVAENIALDAELEARTRWVNWGNVRRLAQDALKKINVKIDLDARVEQISVADKQLVAISRALLKDARLIIMDEPTTALTGREVRSLFNVIKNIREQQGVAILFVSHKLNEVLEIAERVMILRNGRTVVDVPAHEVDRDKLVFYMTGHTVDESSYDYAPAKNVAAPLLQVENLSLPGAFSEVSFSLAPREIVGIAGLLGSGRTDLALALFGKTPAKSGTIRINGKPARIHSIRDAVNHGIGYVPEDRLTEGLFLEQAIGKNIVITTVGKLVGAGGFIDSGKLDRQIDEWVGNLSIKTRSPDNPVRTLSGGNQQRVVLAKWLASAPRILILNGPTVGVDIGSKNELHEIMKNLAREGMGLLVISDDIPELLQTCNRILLMRRGRIVDEFARDAISEGELTHKLLEA